MRNQLIRIITEAADTHDTYVAHKEEQFNIREQQCRHDELQLNEGVNILHDKQKAVEQREQIVGNREAHVKEIYKIAADRKAHIERLIENQKVLIKDRLKAEQDMKAEREKRVTSDKMLHVCLQDKEKLEQRVQELENQLYHSSQKSDHEKAYEDITLTK